MISHDFRSRRVYDSAEVVAEFSAVIQTGEHAGQPIRVRQYSGYASHGYKSGYQRVPQMWLEIAHGQTGTRRIKTYVFCYTGRRIAKIQKDFDENIRALQTA